MASNAINEPTAKRKTTAKEKVKIVKSLSKYAKGIWRYVIVVWFFIAIEVVCEVLIPFCSEFIIEIINPGSEAIQQGYNIGDHVGELWGYAGIMVGLAVLAAVVGIFAGFFAAKAAALFGRNLRQAMYYKIQDFSFANIDKFSTPSLVTRLTTDVTNVQNSVQQIIRTVVRAPFMMIFALAMAAVKSWQIALIFAAIVPFLTVVLFAIAINVHPVFVKVFEAYDELDASVQENLQGIRVVKSFGREEFEKEKFGKVSYFIYKTFIKAERLLALNNPALQLAIYASMLLASYFGAQMIFASGNAPEGFNTGSLTALFSYIMQIMNSMMFVTMAFVMIIIARNSAERISEVINE